MSDLECAGSIPLAVLAVGLVLASAAGIGHFVVLPATTKKWSRCDVTLVQIAVGLNLFGVAAFILGMAKLLTDTKSTVLLAGCTIVFVATLGWRHFRGRPSSRTIRPSGSNLIAIIAAILFAAFTLGPALCYPTGWDELVYHSVLPERWMKAGRPAFFPDLPYSGFPSLSEILFWLMAPLDHLIAPRLLNWVCWILGLACLYRVLKPLVKGTPAVAFTMAFAANDTILLISANCYVESVLLLDVTALLLALSRSVGPAAVARINLAALGGILAGGAAAVKLTGCAVLAAPIIWYADQVRFKRSRWRELVQPILTYVFVAATFCVPFYCRSWLATGNPFYPFFGEWFFSDAARLDMSQHHHAIGSLRFGVSGLASFFDAPLLLVFRSVNYDGGFGWQLTLFLFLAVLAMVSAVRRRSARRIAWPLFIALWFYVAWFFTAQQARFAISALVAIVILAAAGLRTLPRTWRQLAVLVSIVLTVVSVPWWRVDYYRASWLTAFGRLSRTDYVHNVTDRVYLPMVQAVHALTRSDANLMLLYEHRGLYLNRQYVIGTPRFQEGPYTSPHHYESAESILQVLKRHHITHVLLAKVNPSPDLEPGWIELHAPFLRALESCIQKGRLIPRWESEIYQLLEVAELSAETNRSENDLQRDSEAGLSRSSSEPIDAAIFPRNRRTIHGRFATRPSRTSR